MTDASKTDVLPNDRSPLAALHAEVERLMSLSLDAFADLVPDALPPLVATIRAIPSGISRS